MVGKSNLVLVSLIDSEA